MALETINKIKQAEKEAADKIDLANQRAEQMIEQAKLQAKAHVNNAVKNAEQNSQMVCEKARKAACENEKEILENWDKQISQISQNAEKNQKNALEAVIKKIIG